MIDVSFFCDLKILYEHAGNFFWCHLWLQVWSFQTVNLEVFNTE